jgi:hypothetical protein
MTNDHERDMTDVFVYYFMRHGGPGGKELLSKRRATLKTIQGKGEAVMQSRQIVDATEVDGNGFVIGGASDGPHALDELWPQIRSLELRAKSRDCEALKIVEGAEGERKQLLHLESIELRNQARILKTRVERTNAHYCATKTPRNPSATGPRRQQSVVFALDDGVALTGPSFQTLAIEDRDVPPGILDETGFLQLQSGLGHAFSANPEHVGDEFLGHH